MLMRQILAAILLLTNSTLLTTAQQAEIKKIEARLLAPCCYSQSIAQHMSGEAEEMRNEVTEMVAEGRGESEIIDHYKSLYGERILIVPEGITGKILFAMPVFVFLLGCAVLWLIFQKMLRPGADQGKLLKEQEPAPLTNAVRDRIDRETGEEF
jgi:cytochrome c-type biogenesis protein CcmH